MLERRCRMALPVDNRAGLPADALGRIATDVGSPATLEEVVRWGLSRTPRRLVVDVVRQDEFSHDVVVEHAEGRYLVYDTT